jgi:flagellar FliL protein
MLFFGLSLWSLSACQVEISPHPILGEIVGDLTDQSGAGSEEEASGPVPAEGTPPVALTVYDLGEFKVNLRGSLDKSGARVLSVGIRLEIDAALADTMHVRKDGIRDAVLLLASDYSYTELEGMDGKLRLRDDVHAGINRVLAPDRVERVYFTQFLVQ